MKEKKYYELLFSINAYFQKDPIILYWENGLKVRGKSFSGIYETDMEPEDEDYIGEYAVAVNEVEILEPASDEYVEIYKGSIEISLNCIPTKVALEDGTVLWTLDD